MSSGPQAGQQLVLIVDDSRDIADSLAMLVQAWGYEPVVAYDGRTALQLAAQHHPVLALVDINMPDMDGHEVAREARQIPGLEHAVLIAMSGFAEGEGRKPPEGEFDLYFVKPVDPEELRRVLRMYATHH